MVQNPGKGAAICQCDRKIDDFRSIYFNIQIISKAIIDSQSYCLMPMPFIAKTWFLIKGRSQELRYFLFIHLWEMLTSALRALIKNPVKKNFYEKRKKTINVLTIFFIFHKNDVKTFLIWILNECHQRTRQHDPFFINLN